VPTTLKGRTTKIWGKTPLKCLNSNKKSKLNSLIEAERESLKGLPLLVTSHARHWQLRSVSVGDQVSLKQEPTWTPSSYFLETSIVAIGWN